MVAVWLCVLQASGLKNGRLTYSPLLFTVPEFVEPESGQAFQGTRLFYDCKPSLLFVIIRIICDCYKYLHNSSFFFDGGDGFVCPVCVLVAGDMSKLGLIEVKVRHT
jgi:hypothetical protein